MRKAGAREQRPSVLMEVDVQDPAGFVETVHHAVPVVRIDVHVRDAMPVTKTPRHRDGDVVENAESARATGMRMVEAAPRMERGASMLDREVESIHGSLDQSRRGLVAPAKGRRVTGIEQDPPLETARVLDEIHVLGPMERLQGRTARHFDRMGPTEGTGMCRRHGRLEQPGRESTASLGERVERAEIVLEESVRPDGVGPRGRHGSLPPGRTKNIPGRSREGARVWAALRWGDTGRSRNDIRAPRGGVAK